MKTQHENFQQRGPEIIHASTHENSNFVKKFQFSALLALESNTTTESENNKSSIENDATLVHQSIQPIKILQILPPDVPQIDKSLPISTISLSDDKSHLIFPNFEALSTTTVKFFKKYLEVVTIIFANWTLNSGKHALERLMLILEKHRIGNSIEEMMEYLEGHFLRHLAPYFYRKLSYREKVRLVSKKSVEKLFRLNGSDSPFNKRVKDLLKDLLYEFFSEANFVIEINECILDYDEKLFLLKYHGKIRAEAIFGLASDWIDEELKKIQIIVD